MRERRKKDEGEKAGMNQVRNEGSKEEIRKMKKGKSKLLAI